VLGSAVGHNVKIGSGFVVYPGRMIGSNTTLIYAEPRSVIGRNVNTEGDHGYTPPDEDDDIERVEYLWPHRLEEELPPRRPEPPLGTIESRRIGRPSMPMR
jgi:hypothetical protein